MPADTTQLLADAQALANSVIDSTNAKTKADADAAVAAQSGAAATAAANTAHQLAVALKADIDALDPAPATPPAAG